MDPKSPPPQPSDTLQGSQPMNMSAAAMQNLMANHPRASAFNRLSHPLPFMDLGGQPQAHAHQMMQHLLAQAGPPGYPPGFGLVGFPPPPGPLPPELTASIHSQRSNSNRQDGRAGTHSYASRHQQVCYYFGHSFHFILNFAPFFPCVLLLSQIDRHVHASLLY